ncbi:hypothetical protein SPRG_20293 [Saprolegnia parasitica CBS 223.65]|uniref:Uncharacterized protein n=1 Tax=Saprolegnia parasitica (strain CBS 223.65) TaxID=695850 RepID=A0A067CCB9_SAPPC|nr:hypothetical protein SPRG_20293 [Saprolegnia parasitica CBS 223.65]KDO28133.1 hypothetical protein SPRG_20293 [Saprolegnia parasitica CBS 223.65]|eukprot:XP_012201271.1 hypothetical protein SPRG_20293 [Saprolegnia parasitica CBS 223.65]
MSDPIADLYDVALGHLATPREHGFTHHTDSFTPPELSVDGLDEVLTWPLSDAQAAKLAVLYGRDATTTVVPGRAISVDSKPASIYTPVSFYEAVQDKLLLCEWNGRFELAHLVLHAAGSTDTSLLQPSDVDGRAFARLIVLLPSHCVGGNISLTYHDQDEEWSVATAARPPTGLSFAAAAAFLSTVVSSDPISDGRRVALIYHLVNDKATPDCSFASAPPSQAYALGFLRTLANVPFLGAGRVLYRLQHDVAFDPTGFKALSKADTAFVRALDASGCYDYVLAEASSHAYPYVFSVIAPDGADIPAMVLAGATGFAHTVLGKPNPHPQHRKLSMLAFWPRSYRLRLLGIKAAVAHVEAVMQGDAEPSLLGYSTKMQLVEALVYMVGAQTDSGSKYHWDGERRPVAERNPMLSHFWYDNSTDAEPMTARLLQILLDLNDFRLLDVFLTRLMENEVHPKMDRIWLKFHACVARFGYDALAPAVHRLLKRWATSSRTAAAHVPFWLLASLAGVAADPVCAALEHPEARDRIQCAYRILWDHWDVPSLFREPETIGRFDVTCSLATDARLHLIKNCLLLEDYLTRRAPSPLETCLPVPVVDAINECLAPASILDSMPDDYAAMTYIAAPAIVGPRHLPVRALASFEHRLTVVDSVDAILGNLLLHAIYSDADDDELLAYVGSLRSGMGFPTCTLVAALCAFLKLRSVARRTLDVFATVICRVTDCLYTPRGDVLAYLLPHYFNRSDVAVQYPTSTLFAVCEALLADALGFFATYAPQRAPLLVRQVRSMAELASRSRHLVSPAAVLVPLLSDFAQRWPTLPLTVRDQLADIVRPLVQATAAKAGAPIHGLLGARCLCPMCIAVREFLRTPQWRLDKTLFAPCQDAARAIADLQAAGFVVDDDDDVSKVMTTRDDDDVGDTDEKALPSWQPILQAQLHLAALDGLA